MSFLSLLQYVWLPFWFGSVPASTRISVYVLEGRTRDECTPACPHLLPWWHGSTSWFTTQRSMLVFWCCFSCKQNCWHTLKDRKWVLQALCVIQNVLVLMPLYNQQKVKNNKDKQTVFPSVSLKHPDNWFSQFFSHCIDQLLWPRALQNAHYKNALVNLLPFPPLKPLALE